jgi:hypothetical protein
MNVAGAFKAQLQGADISSGYVCICLTDIEMLDNIFGDLLIRSLLTRARRKK